MNIRRIILVLLSPILLLLAIAGLLVGLLTLFGRDVALLLSLGIDLGGSEGQNISYQIARLILLPFQLVFIILVWLAAFWVFRHRDRLGAWVIGEPLMDEGHIDGSRALRPERRRTLKQIFSSLIAVAALVLAFYLALSQFMDRADLAVVIAALTTSLTWGARLPIGDILGGMSNLFESHLAIGDHVQYRQVDQTAEGIVESVDLRFLTVRALTGEAVSIPFGELRVFRNFSRGDMAGVYVVFPVAAERLAQAYAVLEAMTERSTSLIPELMEPWQPMSLDGELSASVNVCLFCLTTRGHEDTLQLNVYKLVHAKFAEANIRVGRTGAGMP
ncbi:MAG TPA: mechanosensitive ion channel family protein [Promineifilum sp.]